MRRTIHLVERDAQSRPLVCLACREKGPVNNQVPRHLVHRMPAITANASDWETIYKNHPEYRRCIDDPTALDRPPPRFPAPTEPGFYWASWRIVAPKSFGASPKDRVYENEPPDGVGQCRVVEVYYRYHDLEDQTLVVDVPGVAIEQELDSFVWRSARLTPPAP